MPDGLHFGPLLAYLLLGAFDYPCSLFEISFDEIDAFIQFVHHSKVFEFPTVFVGFLPEEESFLILLTDSLKFPPEIIDLILVLINFMFGIDSIKFAISHEILFNFINSFGELFESVLQNCYPILCRVLF